MTLALHPRVIRAIGVGGGDQPSRAGPLTKAPGGEILLGDDVRAAAPLEGRRIDRGRRGCTRALSTGIFRGLCGDGDFGDPLRRHRLPGNGSARLRAAARRASGRTVSARRSALARPTTAGATTGLASAFAVLDAKKTDGTSGGPAGRFDRQDPPEAAQGASAGMVRPPPSCGVFVAPEESGVSMTSRTWRPAPAQDVIKGAGGAKLEVSPDDACGGKTAFQDVGGFGARASGALVLKRLIAFQTKHGEPCPDSVATPSARRVLAWRSTTGQQLRFKGAGAALAEHRPRRSRARNRPAAQLGRMSQRNSA